MFFGGSNGFVSPYRPVKNVKTQNLYLRDIQNLLCSEFIVIYVFFFVKDSIKCQLSREKYLESPICADYTCFIDLIFKNPKLY